MATLRNNAGVSAASANAVNPTLFPAIPTGISAAWRNLTFEGEAETLWRPYLYKSRSRCSSRRKRTKLAVAPEFITTTLASVEPINRPPISNVAEKDGSQPLPASSFFKCAAFRRNLGYSLKLLRRMAYEPYRVPGAPGLDPVSGWHSMDILAPSGTH